MKKPANRGGATAGLSNAFRAVRDERYALEAAPRQDLYVARRFGLTAATAAVVAELAFPTVDQWRARP